MAIATFPERDFKANYVVCTSTTRPPPFNGLQIYETDTNKNLIYRTGDPTGWFPPWNTAWGYKTYALSTSPPGWVTLVSTQVSLNDVQVYAGRLYTVKYQCRFRSDVSDTLTAFGLQRGINGGALNTQMNTSELCSLTTASNMSVWMEAQIDFLCTITGLDDFALTAVRQTATSATHTSSFAAITIYDVGPG